MPRDVMSFFEQYRDAFDHLDGNAVAALYCVPSAIADQRGLTSWTSREPIIENMTTLCQLYQSNGYKSAHFVPGQYFLQGSDFAVADVEWTIERQGNLEPWRFRTTYNLRRTEDGWRVLLCTAYEEKRLNA
jgi:hypothetical protein